MFEWSALAQFSSSKAQDALVEDLLAQKAASRIHKKDASLYNFSHSAEISAQNFMGWTDLASCPPYSLDEIKDLADELISEGLERVVLIGEGGSSQAAMTLSKVFSQENSDIRFSTLDSLSPLYMHRIMADIDIEKAVIIVSSKSGTTLETSSMARIIWDFASSVLGEERAAKRFIVITDPNTRMHKLALERGYRAVFLGEPSVGGRFSALSVFGLVPAALIGMDIHKLIENAARMEERCSQDNADNPGLQLAAFLFANVSIESAHAFSYLSPQPGRVLGLWIEQLVAESLGKNGKGIVPQIAIDPKLLNPPYPVRPVLLHTMEYCCSPMYDCDLLDASVPCARFCIEGAYDLGAYFVMWEYAVAMLGYLLGVDPFNQPDVAEAKTNSSRALHGLLPYEAKALKEDWLIAEASDYFYGQEFESLDEILDMMFESTREGDWVSINAFLPFTGDRRAPLENIRYTMAKHLALPVCLEIGPRYLHSTGQLHKGGPNTGIFFTLSASEDDDILVPGESHSLSDIMIAQSKGDLYTLSQRGRRAIHLHLENNHPETLIKLADAFERAAQRSSTKAK